MLAGRQVTANEGAHFMAARAVVAGPAVASTTPDTELTARLRASIGRLARRLNASADPVPGLTPTEISVLGVLVRQGPLGLGELAVIESVNPTMLSRVVAKLVSAALVDRVPDPTDHRAVLAGATPDGRRVHGRIREERTVALTEALSRLPAAQSLAVLASVPAFEALAGELAVVNSERRTAHSELRTAHSELRTADLERRDGL